MIDPRLVHALLGLWLLVALYTAGHALLHKRDPRSAWAWIAVCALFPFAGPALYLLFGVNRVQRYAQRLVQPRGLASRSGREHPDDLRHDALAAARLPASLEEVARTADVLTGRPLLAGNAIRVHEGGEAVYPRMLAAIDTARHCVCLASYIFDADTTGRAFIAALARAQQRGVAVRVLLDGIGERYSWPPASRLLRAAGVPVARFNPPRLWPPSVHLNLRNHRKLLWVDGELAYTGGMNIGDRHLLADGRAHRVADTHGELQGPVLAQLAEAFAEDWLHASGERWTPPPVAATARGGAIARVLTDGPHEEIDALVHVYQAAISAARERVSLLTPYFLPPPELAAELVGAALRGVRVEIVLPARNNLPYVHWATQHALPALLARGVRVFEQDGPFCHSKLFVVDGQYAQIGSANLDARSLRLNFEMNVEVYDTAFARDLTQRVDAALARSRPLDLARLRQRRLPARLRDAACWLFSPYL